MVRWLLIGFSFTCFAENIQEGQAFGKQIALKAFENPILANDLLSTEQKNKRFDPQAALQQVNQQKIPQNEALDFLLSEGVQKNERENKGFHEDDFFLKNSENLAKQEDTSELVEENAEHTLHTCQQSGEPFVLNLIRELHVGVTKQPEKTKEEKICKGHLIEEEYYWKSEAKEAAKYYEKKFKSDPTIKSYDIDYKGSALSDYVLIVTWTHHKNTEACHHYKMKETILQEEALIESNEQWIYEDSSLIALTQGPDCVLIEQVCIDNEPTKNINGKSITRKCWKEKLSFFYQFPQVKDCYFLKEKNCDQIAQKCLHSTPFGCALWEFTFKCFDRLVRSVKFEDDFYGTHQWETEYQPNQSFLAVVTKLSVFEEIKKELEQMQAFDASKVTIFKGQDMKCSKNVAGDLLYDCCFTQAGLAKQVGLAKCTSDELALAEMREKGLCHYVGSYEEKMLDLWKSRDEHVFCCYPTKLSRVVHEEGRKQLKKGWGSPGKPNCEGFSFEEISQIDFSKMDLSEVFDHLPNPKNFNQKITDFKSRLESDGIDSNKVSIPIGFEAKMQSFQNRLQQDLKQEPQN